MKKILLASAALVAFGAAAAQAADPVKLSIGGYAAESVGYASNAEALGLSKVDQQDDININFVGSTKLDNGISVAVEVDTFGTQRQDTRNVNAGCGTGTLVSNAKVECGNSDVKRSFVALTGGFGAVILGEREDVGYIVHNSAPSVGTTGLQDGGGTTAWYQWVANPTNHRVYTATNTSRYDDRTNKITYVTPAFYGLAAGVTYVPNISLATASGNTSMISNSDSNNVNANAGSVNGTSFAGDLYVGGLAYANKFGDIGVKADAGIGQANIANLRIYQGGTQISFAGFTVGGSILSRNVPDSGALRNSNQSGASALLLAGDGTAHNVAQTAAYAGQSWDAGVSYATGPYAVSVGYFHDASKSLGVLNGTGQADTTSVWELGGSYLLGPGVALKASVAKVSYDGGNGGSLAAATPSLGGNNNYNNHNQGDLVVTGVRVDF
jgi:hypothetical protein